MQRREIFPSVFFDQKAAGIYKQNPDFFVENFQHRYCILIQPMVIYQKLLRSVVVRAEAKILVNLLKSFSKKAVDRKAKLC